MKVLLLLLFVGGISATLHEAWEKASKAALGDFKQSLSEATPLHEALGIEDSEIVKRFQSDVKHEILAHVEEVFKKALKNIEEAINKGKEISKDAVRKLKELQKKLHELKGIQDHEIEGFKQQISDKVREILDKMGLKFDKRDIEDDLLNSMIPDFNIRNFLISIKQMILEKMNVPSLKVALTKIVGQASDTLCQWLTNRGKEKVLNFFDRFLESDPVEDLESEVDKRRSADDLYEQFREYLDRLELDLKGKYDKFRDWVKKVVETGLDKSKDKIEDVRHLAKELLKKSKEVSKDVASEALEYLHQYKEELGSLYDEVREKIMKKLMEYTD